MADEAKRNEFIMNETGIIYGGSKQFIREIPWNFGQFDGSILDCALYLLERIPQKVAGHSNAAEVCRTIAATANHSDRNAGVSRNENHGVLMCRWTKNYPKNSTNPSVWAGSSEIVHKFWQNKHAVRYGQSHCLAGLVTSCKLGFFVLS